MKIEGSRIIVAADFSELCPAVELAEKVGPHVFGIKVGSEIAEAVGAPKAVEAIVAAGCGVFRDLKTYDIKNTDVRTMAAAVQKGVVMVNMHALNGKKKMSASAEAVRKRAKELGIPAPLVLAVTILTDNDWDDLKELGFFDHSGFSVGLTTEEIAEKKVKMVQELVIHLAKLAQEAGLDGVIASAQEAPMIRKACGKNFVIATPGIRPADAPPDDQKRTLTPAEAIEAGADLLVIGRPITGAADPLAVVKQFNADIAAALEAMRPKFVRPSQLLIRVPRLRHEDQVYLDLLRACGGYYHAVLDPKTELPIGSLVGYSGTYEVEGSGEKRQYVGYVYYNLATLEQYPPVADLFAQGLAGMVKQALTGVTCVVGVPDGGNILAQNTARHLDVMYAGMQKKVIELETKTTKEKTKLVLGRHSIQPGMDVVLCEDLVNNFSTTDKAIAVVEEAGARVIGFICGVNRSEDGVREYHGLPVISLVFRPTPQYRQEEESNSVVAYHLKMVGFLTDVKPNWATVAKAMADAEARGIKIV